MPKLMALISYRTPPDVDGEQLTKQKEVDIFSSLTSSQQIVIDALVQRALVALIARYGAEVRIDSLRYVVG